MAKKESLQKRIDIIEGKIKFFRSALLALISAIVWSGYALLERIVGKEIIYLSLIGVFAMIVIFVRIKLLEAQEEKLLKELEKE